MRDGRQARGVYEPEDLWLLRNDARRYELLHGTVVVTPEMSHATRVLWSTLAMLLHCLGKTVGLQMCPGTTLCRAGKATELAPDIVVMRRVERHGLYRVFEPMRRVKLAVDFRVNASSSDDDRRHIAFLKSGGREWWYVDPVEKSVRIWRRGAADAEVVLDTVLWQPVETREAMIIDLHALFADSTDATSA